MYYTALTYVHITSKLVWFKVILSAWYNVTNYIVKIFTIAHFILRKWSGQHSSCKQSKKGNVKGNIDDKNWLAKCSPLMVPHLLNNRSLQQCSSFVLNLKNTNICTFIAISLVDPHNYVHEVPL